MAFENMLYTNQRHYIDKNVMYRYRRIKGTAQSKLSYIELLSCTSCLLMVRLHLLQRISSLPFAAC